MAQPTIIGMLFCTGLLKGIPQRSALKLHDAVTSAYRHVDVPCADTKIPAKRFVTLQQVISTDPASAALACFSCMLMHSKFLDMQQHAHALAESTGDETLLSLKERAESRERDMLMPEDETWTRAQLAGAMVALVDRRLQEVLRETKDAVAEEEEGCLKDYMEGQYFTAVVQFILEGMEVMQHSEEDEDVFEDARDASGWGDSDQEMFLSEEEEEEEEDDNE